MKNNTGMVLLFLAVILTGGVALWFITRRQSAIAPSGAFTNTRTSSPWDFLNPFRTSAVNNGLRTSSQDRTLSQIQAYAGAVPAGVKALGDLFGSVGGLFRGSGPTFATSGTFNQPLSPVAAPGFIGNYDFEPVNTIEAADNYFYA